MNKKKFRLTKNHQKLGIFKHIRNNRINNNYINMVFSFFLSGFVHILTCPLIKIQNTFFGKTFSYLF